MTILTGRSDQIAGRHPAAPQPPPEEAERPLYADIAAFFDKGMPPPLMPGIVTRDDGCGLFYAGHVNVLYGDPECGKTWIALAGIEEQAKADGRCLFSTSTTTGWPQ